MKKRFYKILFSAMLTAAFLLSGCGSSDQTSVPTSVKQPSAAIPADTDGETASEQRYYKATEKAVPDLRAAFKNNPENEGKLISPITSFCADGTLYFLYGILNASNKAEDDPFLTDGYCLGILNAPYEQWEYHVFSTDEAAADSVIPSILYIAGVGSDGIFFLLTDNRLAFYSWNDGSFHSLDQIDLSGTNFYRHAVYPVDDAIYVISSDSSASSGSFTSYNKDLQPVLTQNLQNEIYGCISGDSESLWYGSDEEGYLAVWDKPNGTCLYSLEVESNTYSNIYSDSLLTESDTGEFILASIQPFLNGIWTGHGDSPLEQALSFSEMGYTLQELLTVSANGDDGFFIIAYFEDKLICLNLERTAVLDKQVITLVSSDLLGRVTAAFNRQSDKYRVTVINPFVSGDMEAYCQQLQMEISSGKGPDIMDDWLINMDGCIKNGYLEPLDDLITNPSDFWPAIWDASETDGVLYGISMRFLPSFLFVSKSLAGDLESWDIAQMMEAVQKSPAESLQLGLDSMDIVLQYGLAARDNPQFIDYETGVSHLSEQLFIDFLEFAKKYGDDLYYTNAAYEEAGDYYRDGKIAAIEIEMYSPRYLLYASSCFEGQEVLIGMPSIQGRRVYMSPVRVCLNSNSPVKEGAKEFLRYLLSEEGQLLYLQNVLGGISCRKDVSEQYLNEYQEETENGKTYFHQWGIDAVSVPMTDEQREQLWNFLEEAVPQPSIPSEIEAVVREELVPYFAGDCSAKEAAEKLNNRVQLYLDENR